MNIILRTNKILDSQKKRLRERENEIQVKGTVPFTEPAPPFPVVPALPASPALLYPSLPQSDSREEGANDLLDGDSLH